MLSRLRWICNRLRDRPEYYRKKQEMEKSQLQATNFVEKAELTARKKA